MAKFDVKVRQTPHVFSDSPGISTGIPVLHKHGELFGYDILMHAVTFTVAEESFVSCKFLKKHLDFI